MANGVRKNPDGSIEKLINGRWVKQGVNNLNPIKKNKTPKVLPPATDGTVDQIKDQGDVADTTMELGGASGQAFLDELSNIGKGKQNVIDTNYNYMTRNFERDKARDLEAKKQELAQRGIPIDAGDNSLWTKTIGGVEENYQNQYADANAQALNMGNQFYNDSVQNSAILGGTANKFLDTLTQAYMQKYGIDKAAATQLATAKIRGSGGGGGSGDDGGDIFIG